MEATSPFSDLAMHLAALPETKAAFVRGGLPAALMQLHREDRAATVLGAWAPGTASDPGRAKYKKRSFQTALVHMHEVAARAAPPRCLVLGASKTERIRDGSKPELLKRHPAVMDTAIHNFGGHFARQIPEAFIHSAGGDAIENVFFRLQCTFDHCFAAHVRTIVILLGVNSFLSMGGAGVESEGNVAQPARVAVAMQAMIHQLHAATAAAGNHGVDIVICHELKVHSLHRDRSGARDAEAINSRIDELNAYIDRLTHCRVCCLAFPSHASMYQKDKLHLSEAGYKCLLPQLLEVAPMLAAVPTSRVRCDCEKEAMKLAKKLREIERLQELMCNGVTLQENQRKKVEDKAKFAIGFAEAMEALPQGSDVLMKVSDVVSKLASVADVDSVRYLANVDQASDLLEAPMREPPSHVASCGAVSDQAWFHSPVARAIEDPKQRGRRPRPRGGRNGFQRKYDRDH